MSARHVDSKLGETLALPDPRSEMEDTWKTCVPLPPTLARNNTSGIRIREMIFQTPQQLYIFAMWPPDSGKDGLYKSSCLRSDVLTLFDQRVSIAQTG